MVSMLELPGEFPSCAETGHIRIRAKTSGTMSTMPTCRLAELIWGKKRPDKV